MRQKQPESRDISGSQTDDSLISDQQPNSRKRRPSKPLEKNYACPETGCGKCYSRAEHLSRHRLNHTPKQIYHCNHEGCDRFFVRQDLCLRHQERHVNATSHISRRGISRTRKVVKTNPEPSSLTEVTRSASVGTPRQASEYLLYRTSTSDGSDTHVSENSAESELANAITPRMYNDITLDPRLTFHEEMPEPTNRPRPYHTGNNRSNIEAVRPLSDAATFGSEAAQPESVEISERTIRYSPRGGHADTTTFLRHHGSSIHVPSPTHSNSLAESKSALSLNSVDCSSQGPQVGDLLPLYPHPCSSRVISPIDKGSIQAPAPFGFSLISASHLNVMRADSVTSFATKEVLADIHPSGTLHNDPAVGETESLNRVHAALTMPVFNNELFNHAQGGAGDDFMGWLFNDEQHQHQYQQPNQDHSMPPPICTSHSHRCGPGEVQCGLHQPRIEPVPNLPIIPSILDSGQPESILSGPRRQRLLKTIREEFRDERHAQATQYRQRVFHGNHDEESHVLSLHMLQIYINSFWIHIHSQLPIMHRPTFSAETCPDLLLIAIMSLGASCLEKDHGYETTQACAELSFFLAWHTRHLIYEDPDFLPPAKLWVFQALLILEIFEKMYSTRSLHERAHVHHATTLTLMRRGSSLVGRSVSEVPLHENDPTRTPPGPNGSINTSGRNTPDAWWNHWISNEATRRTAFAAFIIDTTHATMFGHSAVMVVHEMRISLPCDESIWSAASGAEVQRMEQELAVRGLSPLSFLEGLKKTLNGQPVRTNTFGRVVIMSGLLSISWNQKMQDVRVSSTGVGKLSSWGSQVLRAFDFWKQDFDVSLGTPNSIYLRNWLCPHNLDIENVFESRTVLHCLAHMAMHVDVIDCQIFAGAKCLLGRAITTHEHAAALKRMKENWAPSARARDATFYALRFLSEVLRTEDSTSVYFHYSVRDDNLLNRPWVLYFATLVVWSYGFALDGPIAPPTYTLSTPENKFHDMQGFLRRVGGVNSPDDLQNVKHRNSCLGLLMLVRDMFRTTRWELLHEATNLLRNCIEILMPGISQ